MPLCELASKRLIEKSPTNPIFNEDNMKEQKRQEWCKSIISYYKKIIRKWLKHDWCENDNLLNHKEIKIKEIDE